MPSDTSAWITAAIVTLMVAAWLLAKLPSCGHTDCVAAHAAHSVTDASASMEKQHITYHDRLRPQPNCVMCQAQKRDDDGTP